MKKQLISEKPQEQESHEFLSNQTKWYGILITKEECSRPFFILVVLKIPGIFLKLSELSLAHPEGSTPAPSQDFYWCMTQKIR